LRVLPLAMFEGIDLINSNCFWLAIFRASFVLWAQVVYRLRIDGEVSTSGSEAGNELQAALKRVLSKDRDERELAAAAAAEAAEIAVGTLYLSPSPSFVAVVVADHALSAADNTGGIHNDAANAVDDVLSSIAADAEWLDAQSGNAWASAASLARQRLWLNEVRRSGGPRKRYGVNMPLWARLPWDVWKGRAGSLDPWPAWYDARLAGRAAGGFHRALWSGDAAETLDREIAARPPEFWDRHPGVVSAAINGLIATALEERPAKLDKPPQQHPAAFRFTVKDGRIGVLSDAPPPDVAFTADTRAAVLEKAKAAIERLQTTQTPTRAIETIQSLIDALGDGVADIRPGVLRQGTVC
jgi:hypothetical protein